MRERRVGSFSFLRDYINAITYSIKGVSSNAINTTSAGLVYSTLIAVIPFLAIVISFLSIFGISEQFMSIAKSIIIDALGETYGRDITALIERFSLNATGLGIVGIFSFLVTSLILVDKVYIAFNRIFKTRVKSVARRYSNLVLFLLLLCTFIAVSIITRSSLITFLHRFYISGNKGGIIPWKSVVAIITLFLALSAIYKFIPRARINFKAVLAGSITGTIGLAVSFLVLKNVVVSIVKYSVIYGSVGSVFLSLLYLYVSWFIILFSAEIVYVYQFKQEKSLLSGYVEPPSEQVATAVNLFLLISDNYKKGRRPLKLKEIMEYLGTPSSVLTPYLAAFEKDRLLMKINGAKGIYIPRKPLDKIYLSDIISSVYGSPSRFSDEDIETMGEAVALDFFKSGLSIVSGITVEDLLGRL